VPGRVALAEVTATLREALATHVADAVRLTGQSLPTEFGRSEPQIARGELL